jgi:glycosyltransferase involved in cell wall biosynthesis
MPNQNAKLRVLFCRSNPVDPDPRVQKEASALLRAGYLAAVIGWDRTARLPREENRAGLVIHRMPIQAPFANGLMNLPNLLRWQIRLMLWLAQHRSEYDIIHACDFDTILPALWAKRLWQKKVVYDIFDFYADHLRRTPAWLKRLIRRRDLRAIGEADAMILCDDSRFEQVAGSHPRRTAVIYNTPEDISAPSAFTPSPPGQLHLAYVGLVQVERMLFEMISVLRRHPEWSLEMAGFGGDEQRVINEAQRLPNLRWHGRVPYERALEINARADLMFALYDPAVPNHRYSSANKIFEAMMLSKPVLVAAGTGMDRIVAAADSGLVLPYGDEDSLEAALSRLARDPALRLRLGDNGRQAYIGKYAWNVMEERLLDLYRTLK